jgi:hypothetical protein
MIEINQNTNQKYKNKMLIPILLFVFSNMNGQITDLSSIQVSQPGNIVNPTPLSYGYRLKGICGGVHLFNFALSTGSTGCFTYSNGCTTSSNLPFNASTISYTQTPNNLKSLYIYKTSSSNLNIHNLFDNITFANVSSINSINQINIYYEIPKNRITSSSSSSTTNYKYLSKHQTITFGESISSASTPPCLINNGFNSSATRLDDITLSVAQTRTGTITRSTQYTDTFKLWLHGRTRVEMFTNPVNRTGYQGVYNFHNINFYTNVIYRVTDPKNWSTYTTQDYDLISNNPTNFTQKITRVAEIYNQGTTLIPQFFINFAHHESAKKK